MNYQIIHDRPGRVRVRFGPNSFNREEGYGIAALLTQKADAIQAETFPINGSVLIYYPKSGRRKILMTLDHICTLPTLPKGSLTIVLSFVKPPMNFRISSSHMWDDIFKKTSVSGSCTDCPDSVSGSTLHQRWLGSSSGRASQCGSPGRRLHWYLSYTAVLLHGCFYYDAPWSF